MTKSKDRKTVTVTITLKIEADVSIDDEALAALLVDYAQRAPGVRAVREIIED